MTYVWVLTALVRSHDFAAGAAVEYIDVFATAEACESKRAEMQTSADKPPANGWVFVCTREQPK